jgi:hypothetical protein
MEKTMRKTLAVLATAATLAVGTVAVPAPAEARCVGCAIGAGLVAGALIGTAIATAPVYGAYYGPGPYYGPPCYWRTRKFWDGYGWVYRRVRVCY